MTNIEFQKLIVRASHGVSRMCAWLSRLCCARGQRERCHLQGRRRRAAWHCRRIDERTPWPHAFRGRDHHNVVGDQNCGQEVAATTA